MTAAIARAGQHDVSLPGRCNAFNVPRALPEILILLNRFQKGFPVALVQIG